MSALRAAYTEYGGGGYIFRSLPRKIPITTTMPIEGDHNENYLSLLLLCLSPSLPLSPLQPLMINMVETRAARARAPPHHID